LPIGQEGRLKKDYSPIKNDKIKNK